MSRVAYVNGRYVPHRAAAVHIEDRGYQFSDGVYEVMAITGGRLLDADLHLARLGRSLRELRMDWPMSERALRLVIGELVRRNRVRDGIVYLQITRGVARRDHAFPEGSVRPSLVLTSRSMRPKDPAMIAAGVRVVTTRDIRWKRRDIKSVSLLPNVLAKQEAKERGAYEAWLVDDDNLVTEGTSTNAWIVNDRNEAITRPATFEILNGCTRVALLEMLAEAGLTLVERPFSMVEALAAKEAFLTSTTSFVLPVVEIDGTPVGDGRPGERTLRLRALYEAHVAAQREAA